MKKLYEEYIKFSIFLAMVVMLTPYLMDTITRSWNTELMKGISNIIRTIDPSGISIFITFMIGFYLGSSILLFLDRKKRIQAFILLIGVIVLFQYMSSNFAIGWNMIYTVLGIIVGIYLGSGFKDINKKGEFRKAASNVSMFSILYISISLIILYASPNVDNSNFIKDSLVIIIFSIFFGLLMGYEVKGPTIFILGPEQSGKTLFLAGCYKRIVDVTESSTKRSSDIIKLTKELHKGWPDRTRDIRTYQFSYEIGKLFPRETTLRTVDYPGVYLKDISNYMDNEEDINKIDDAEKKIKINAAREVINANRLIFILDASRHPQFKEMGFIAKSGFEEMGVDSYLEIVTKLHADKKDIRPYIIVTKSDLFKEEFPNYEEDYEGFKRFIEEKFSGNIFIRELLIESSNATFYPVFYYTKKIENPDLKERETKRYIYIPMIDEYGNIHTYGFPEFMDQLMENE